MSKLNATFFALQRRDRAVLLPATLVLVVILALILAGFFALNWRFLAMVYELIQSADAAGGTAPMSEAMIAPFFGFFGSIFLFLIPIYFAVASYEAACLRWMIRGEAPGLFGLTLDHDMWRVYGIYWCWFIGQFVVSTVVGIATMPLVFASMGEVMRDPTNTEAMWRWQLGVQLPLSFLQYLPMIFLGIRFGPAAATSVALQRFSPIAAWTVTRGRFWALFGSFALVWLIWFALAAAASAPVLMRMWPHVQALFGTINPDTEVVSAYIAAYLAPETLTLVGAGYAVMIIGGLWLSVMFYGINARAALAALEEGKIKPEAAG